MTTTTLCRKHYVEIEKDEPKTLDWFLRAEKTSRHINTYGYVILYFGSGQKMAEHRFVVAKRMNRLLLPHETIHHKNGIRDDNRSENLEYWPSKHGKGQRAEDMIEWHREEIRKLEADLGSAAA